jgi:hypothetical protein
LVTERAGEIRQLFGSSQNCRLKIAAWQATTERLAVVVPVWR